MRETVTWTFVLLMYYIFIISGIFYLLELLIYNVECMFDLQMVSNVIKCVM